MSKEFVLSVGGSLISTEEGIDLVFLKKFSRFILKQTKKGFKFYLIIGGGKLARSYIKAALDTAPVDSFNRDLLGIRATQVNAELLRVIFGKNAYPKIISNPLEKIKTNKKIILISGYKPGWSTDYVSVLIALQNKIKTLLNLSNIDYVYNQDPRKFPEAKKLERVSWKKFRILVGNKWKPGLNLPFDPIASRRASSQKMKVIVLNGKNLKNLEKCLNDSKFRGTIIE